MVNFYAADGNAPAQAQVIINGVAHPMTLHSGRASHGTYQHVQRLPAGNAHNFYFAFTLHNGQQARWPITGVIPYPIVAGPTDLPPVDPPAPPETFRHLLYLPQIRR